MNKLQVRSFLFFLLLFSFGLSGYFLQPAGLTGPVAIGKFLNGNLPAVTPGDGQNLNWSVEPAFPNLIFNSPLVITPHPRQDRLFVASRDGLIEHFDYDENTTGKEVLIDLRSEVAVVWDGGFLGLAFHPDFGQAGSPNRNYFYVYYSARESNVDELPQACNHTCFSCADNGNFFGSYLRLARYSVFDGTLTVDTNSELQLFNVRLFNGTHRGGGLHFGKDGFLYLAIGDQARRTTAQDIANNFEGGVIRIDVDQQGGSISHPPRRKMGVEVGESDEFTGVGYYIPNDNPWQAPDNSLFEEYYQNGHRNPHRMTMDRVTGEFWIGEVGAGSREEVTIVKAGQNGGWPIYKGNRFRQFTACNSHNLPLGPGEYNPPVVDFLRSEANAIIGGYVYRGAKFPSLYDQYLCGGYSQNRIFSIQKDADGGYSKTHFADFSPGRLITWGEGPDAELFMGRQSSSTTLYKLKATGSNPPAPVLLSQTGAFSDLINLVPAPGLIPYELIEPFWSDNSDKARWIAIPNNGSHNTTAEKIRFSENGNWQFPNGTVFIKHFELGGKRLETRFEVKGDDGQFYYLTYKWNAAGTDATLLTSGGSASYFQIVDSGWGPVDHCGWQCSNTFSVSGLPAGRYLVFFLDAGYATICQKWIDLTGSNSLGTSATSRSMPHLSLAAYSGGRAVDLQWVTNTGFLNDYFVIEKSEDGRQFREIQQIKNTELGAEMQARQYTDKTPHKGINYYRIRQIAK